jgi:dihydroceramidase
VFFAFGYIVWLIDDWACRILTDVRHTVGIPLAFLFELHGWYAPCYNPSLGLILIMNRWHVFTAIGGYIAVAIVDMTTTDEVREDPTDLFAWPVPFVANLMSGTQKSAKQS